MVQIGWVIVLLKTDEHGDLDIWEPRFGAVPATWVRGANNTFCHLMVQKAVCEQIGLAAKLQTALISPPNPHQKIG
jgi:hypothetical protein